MSDTLAPEIISDVPIPLLDSTSPNPSSTQSNSVTTPTSEGDAVPSTIPDKALSITPVASDVISTSIDSQQRKILGTYTFGQVGALQIGKFKFGVSGQINISPDGIIAENKQGLKYFTLNDAGISITDGTDATILDASGIRSTSQFKNNSLNFNSGWNTTNLTMTDIPGSSFTIVATRPIIVLFNVLVTAMTDANGFQLNDQGVDVQLYDSFLGGAAINLETNYGFAATRIDVSGGVITGVDYFSHFSPEEISSILLVEPGTHDYKLQFAAHGGGQADVGAFVVNYVILGT